jgi:crossover junction endodeoxyribonuclease RuvC
MNNQPLPVDKNFFTIEKKAEPGANTLILGLDPGSVHTGYGLIETQGENLQLISQGRVSPSPDWPMVRRLAYIHRAIFSLIQQTRPTAVAVEDVFTFKNPRSALKLAQARGVVILAPALLDIPVFEYAPGLVKNAVSGNGRAEKSQVAYFVNKILDLDLTLTKDASDALAVAICHAGQLNLTHLTATSKASSSNRAASWRKLDPNDLASLGYQIETE